MTQYSVELTCQPCGFETTPRSLTVENRQSSTEGMIMQKLKDFTEKVFENILTEILQLLLKTGNTSVISLEHRESQ